jgi:hypothetical protein
MRREGHRVGAGSSGGASTAFTYSARRVVTRLRTLWQRSQHFSQCVVNRATEA